MNSFGAYRRWVVLTAAAMLLGCASLAAEILYLINDPIDDRAVLLSVRNDPRLLTFAKEVEAVRKRLLEWKEDDFLSVFGNPTRRTTGLTGASGVQAGDGFAILSTEPRGRALQGLRCGAPECTKDHFDTYMVGDLARVEVVYGPNGFVPADFVFHLKMDRDFVRMDRVENLERRLAWERVRFNELVKRIDALWRLKVVWQVDAEAQTKQFQGIHSWDGAERLEAVAKASQQLNVIGRPEVGLVSFSYPNELTVDYLKQGPGQIMIRWKRARNAQLRYIEYATSRAGRWVPMAWSWFGENEENEVRETDTNGDGLPDRYWKKGMPEASLLPLSVDLSWAVHPELVPDRLRIPDHETRRVPIRRIPE
jgi:hypothetical protein